jgi:hypothetical protein
MTKAIIPHTEPDVAGASTMSAFRTQPSIPLFALN